MTSVVPINNQHYQSGNYTLEVTARSSPLSQWSDKTVVRQLRFRLWSEQPERQRLLTGDQHQLVTVSDAVETYVQSHLTQAAWPSTHRLLLLEKELELSTLQLFDLAEVLNAYEQGQITLPISIRQTQRQPRRRQRAQRWGPGSAVASVLVVVGLTTVYFNYHRPAAFNEVATTQAPTLDDDIAFAPESDAAPDAGAAAPQLERSPAADGEGSPQFKTNRELFQLPLDSAEGESVDGTPAPATPSPATSAEPSLSAPSAEVPGAPADDLSEERFLEQDRLDNAVPEPADIPSASAPAAAPAAPAEQMPEDDAASDSASIATAEAVREEAEQQERFGDIAGADAARSRIETPNTASVLDAISTQLAPYQPTQASYPLAYRLQIEPDGTIIAAEPIGENIPAIAVSGETITPAPGRPLTVEIIYTGDNRPVVNELF